MCCRCGCKETKKKKKKKKTTSFVSQRRSAQSCGSFTPGDGLEVRGQRAAGGRVIMAWKRHVGLRNQLLVLGSGFLGTILSQRPPEDGSSISI